MRCKYFFTNLLYKIKNNNYSRLCVVEGGWFDFVTCSIRLYQWVVEQTYQQATALGPCVFTLPNSLCGEGAVQNIKISTQYMRKEVATKISFPEIIQLHLLRYFRLSYTSRASKSGVVWVSCWATMSSRDYILVCRRQWSCREGNRLYVGPDQRLWENLLLSCCHGMANGWSLLQWGGPWASQAPLVTLLLLWHCLLPSCGCLRKENRRNT